MAKISLSTILSGFQTITQLNQNFTDIVSEFQNKVLYRDNPSGEPNSMQNDLDMNSNDLLNVDTTDTRVLKIDGTSIVPTGTISADADAINYDNTTSGLSATDAQAAIDEIDGDLDAHLADTTDAHDASAISFTPAGDVAAIEVQSAIEELDTEKQPLDAELTAIAGLTSAANKVPYFTGSETAGLLDFLDEDTMSSDSATAVASQQSIKAYVDAVGLPDGYINGLLWENNATDATNDFDISVGVAKSSDNTTALTLASAQTKQMDATWAAGTNAGAITATAWGATGWVAGQSYHVFIAKISGVNEIIVDTDANGANIDTDHSSPPKRRIFSFLAATGPALPTLHTSLNGRNVRATLDVIAQDVSNAGNTSGALATLSVPTGKLVLATVGYRIGHSALAYGLLTETSQANTVPSSSAHDVLVSSSVQSADIEVLRLTDASGQVRYRNNTAISTCEIFTKGYEVIR